MENSELNKFIAVEIMGVSCWHEEPDGTLAGALECPKCHSPRHWKPNPDYTSESSPRSLLAEVEAKVIEVKGQDAYWDALQNQFDWPRDGGTDYIDELIMVTANASTRAKACVEAWKGGGEV